MLHFMMDLQLYLLTSVLFSSIRTLLYSKAIVMKLRGPGSKSRVIHKSARGPDEHRNLVMMESLSKRRQILIS